MPAAVGCSCCNCHIENEHAGLSAPRHFKSSCFSHILKARLPFATGDDLFSCVCPLLSATFAIQHLNELRLKTFWSTSHHVEPIPRLHSPNKLGPMFSTLAVAVASLVTIMPLTVGLACRSSRSLRDRWKRPGSWLRGLGYFFSSDHCRQRTTHHTQDLSRCEI